MRIRRKKHLDERLSLLSDVLIIADRDIPNVNEAILDKKYIDFSVLFGNSNPVYLEIGCGKAGFITECAKRFPDVNFFAVELLENVIVMGAERAKKAGLKNLKFFNCGAEYLPRYIKDNSIDKIFLNFSPPYPQSSYESHRLTYDRFIGYYKNFLKTNCVVEQKTDDKDFFDYSTQQFLKFGFEVEDQTDLLAEDKIFNIQTEYEKKFTDKGIEINKLVAKKV